MRCDNPPNQVSAAAYNPIATYDSCTSVCNDAENCLAQPRAVGWQILGACEAAIALGDAASRVGAVLIALQAPNFEGRT